MALEDIPKLSYSILFKDQPKLLAYL